MVKKYLVVPGYVISKYDGDRHWIGSKQLITLYGVNPKECVIAEDDRRRYPGLIILRPRYDGDYKI